MFYFIRDKIVGMPLQEIFLNLRTGGLWIITPQLHLELGAKQRMVRMRFSRISCTMKNDNSIVAWPGFLFNHGLGLTRLNQSLYQALI